MKLLLDTHAFIWWAVEPQRLPPRVYDACESAENDLLLSLASVLEMQLKADAGRLRLHKPVRDTVEQHLRENALTILPVRADDIYALADLPRIHRDPFDRLLVAQALAEDAPLVTKDEMIGRYPVKVFW